jgi:16S rRNA (guanine527-N7)-methyltransferase
VLIEAIRKKTAFSQHIRGKLKLKNIDVLADRVENVAMQQPDQFDAVISQSIYKLISIFRAVITFTKVGWNCFCNEGKARRRRVIRGL